MVHLTPREGGILALLATGRTNAQIAKKLGISAQTVKNQLSGQPHPAEGGTVGIYRKLGIRKRQGGGARLEAALWWLKHGEAA